MLVYFKKIFLQKLYQIETCFCTLWKPEYGFKTPRSFTSDEKCGNFDRPLKVFAGQAPQRHSYINYSFWLKSIFEKLDEFKNRINNCLESKILLNISCKFRFPKEICKAFVPTLNMLISKTVEFI